MQREILTATLLTLASVATQNHKLADSIEDMAHGIADRLPEGAINRTFNMGLTSESLNLVRMLVESFQCDLDNTSDSVVNAYFETI